MVISMASVDFNTNISSNSWLAALAAHERSAQKVDEQTLAKGAGAFGAGFPTEITPVTGSPQVGGFGGVEGARSEKPWYDDTLSKAIAGNFYANHSSENAPKAEGIYDTLYGNPTVKAKNLFISA